MTIIAQTTTKTTTTSTATTTNLLVDKESQQKAVTDVENESKTKEANGSKTEENFLTTKSSPEAGLSRSTRGVGLAGSSIEPTEIPDSVEHTDGLGKNGEYDMTSHVNVSPKKELMTTADYSRPRVEDDNDSNDSNDSNENDSSPSTNPETPGVQETLVTYVPVERSIPVQERRSSSQPGEGESIDGSAFTTRNGKGNGKGKTK